MGFKKKTYESIDNIVKGVCVDMGEGEERYEQYLHWALKEAKNWYLDFAREVKTIELPINDYLAVDLPDDYVDWTKIGIKSGNQILTFAHDTYMAQPQDTDSDNVPNKDIDLVPDSSEEDGNYFYNVINSHGENTGRMWGQSAKDNYLGYFKIDLEREQIQLRTKISSLKTIYLEFISNGYEACGQGYVHPYVSQLIELFIHWKRLKHNKYSASWQVRDARDDYEREFYRVQNRYSDLGVEDVLEVWREGYSLTPLN